MLFFVLVLSGTALLAQPGYTPGEAITVTAASPPPIYNSRRLPDSVAFNWPEACGSYSAPFYDEFWFKYTAAKDEKVVYFGASTWEGNPDDFMAILFVYEETESGLSQIGCHAWPSSWILSVRPGRTYLVMVAALSSAPGWEDSPLLKHGGTITLYVLSSPIGVWRYRGEEELLGWFWNDQSPDLIGIISTSPNFFCDSSDPTTTPRKFRETLIRNGTDHVLTMGDVYTKVYRPDSFDAGMALLNSDQGWCAFDTTTWLVAQGVAQYSGKDNNVMVTGDKSDAWSESVIGRLDDVTGNCRSGATQFKWHYEAYCPKGTDQLTCPYTMRNVFGPKLTCDSPK